MSSDKLNKVKRASNHREGPYAHIHILYKHLLRQFPDFKSILLRIICLKAVVHVSGMLPIVNAVRRWRSLGKMYIVWTNSTGICPSCPLAVSSLVSTTGQSRPVVLRWWMVFQMSSFTAEHWGTEYNGFACRWRRRQTGQHSSSCKGTLQHLHYNLP